MGKIVEIVRLTENINCERRELKINELFPITGVLVRPKACQ
jgi:hypothetical protein